METQKAIELIADILDVLVGRFTPDCGGDFIEVAACGECPHLHQCIMFSKARKINSTLQSLLVDEEPKDVCDTAYRKGFNDAYAGFEDNPYEYETEPGLHGLYERGNIDGA